MLCKIDIKALYRLNLKSDNTFINLYCHYTMSKVSRQRF